MKRRNSKPAPAASLTLGERVRQARRGLDLTTGEVAKSAGVAASYVTLIEKGQRSNIGLETLERILCAVGLRIELCELDANVIAVALHHRAVQYVDELVGRGLHGIGREGVAEGLVLDGLRREFVPTKVPE